MPTPLYYGVQERTQSIDALMMPTTLYYGVPERIIESYIGRCVRQRCTMTYRIYQTLITLRSQCERNGNRWRLHDDRTAFYEMILHSYYTFHGAAMAIIAIPGVRFYCANLRLHVNEQFQQNSIKEIYNANKPSFYHN